MTSAAVWTTWQDSFERIATRRATLREVNANLTEIAEQLRRLGAPGQSR
jgi:hypothetical protein